MQKQDCLLSVIVPVYNTEAYLHKCIDSILEQTFTDFELILIDDGSTDSSGSICDMYAQKDKRIKVFHISNGGLVHARKYACEIAEGTLITFVDSDDFIEKEMYECMMQKYEETKADIITSGFIFEESGRKQYETDTVEEGYFNKKDISSSIINKMMYDSDCKTRAILAVLCGKLLNKDLLKRGIENIDLRISLGEDAAILYPLIAEAESMVITHNCWYHYVSRKDSMSRTYDTGTFEKLSILEKYLRETFKKIGILNRVEWQIRQHIYYYIELTISNLYGIKVRRSFFDFPCDKIQKGSRIALYGAGNAGREYWEFLKINHYGEVVAWYDKNYDKISDTPIRIENPEEIRSEEFDYIVISIQDAEIASGVKAWLMGKKIDENKIILSNNKCIR